MSRKRLKDQFEEHREEAVERLEKRQSRQERKLMRTKDRSRFKKTDQDQLKKQKPEQSFADLPLKKGRVLSIRGEYAQVDSEGKLFGCHLRGLLKKERNPLKSLIAVGDLVLFEPREDDEGHIWEVEPRKSLLSRADTLSHTKEQILATNVDLVLITASLMLPPLKPSLIDRYVIAARCGQMTPLIVVNKIDLIEKAHGHDAEDEDMQDEDIEDESFLLEQMRIAYQIARVELICVSAKTGEGLDHLQAAMANKASVFAGPSGVGKTSLINALFGTNFATKEAIARTRKGAHTTTRAQLIPLPSGGWVVDTPGVKSYGLWQLNKEQIQQHFAEIAELAPNCFFRSCSHTHEKGCAVLEALEEERVHPLRYDSYCALIEELDQVHRKR